MSTDLHPTAVRVYGYGVAWVPTGHTTWTMDLDEDYLNLPAHYATLAEAIPSQDRGRVGDAGRHRRQHR